MQLRNEAVVDAPLDETWRAILDVPRVARALPGATIEPEGVEGGYRGALKVRLGPVTMQYEGVARLLDADEDDHVATFHLQGRESRGQGGATATIVNRLSAEDGSTRVVVETDVAVTGRAAQFGRGLMEDVAGRMIEQFAARLEREVLAGSRPTEGEPYALSGEPSGGEALDVGAAALAPLLRRYGWALALGAGALALGLAPRTRRIVVIVERR
jgi:carbon monoxide dehydrogenase subunit G